MPNKEAEKETGKLTGRKKNELIDTILNIGFILILLFVAVMLIINPERERKTIEVEFLEITEGSNSKAVYANHEEKVFLEIELSNYELKYNVEDFESIREVEKVTNLNNRTYKAVVNGEEKQLKIQY